jgi:hypothetical protein
MLVDIATTNNKHRTAEIFFLNVSSPGLDASELDYRNCAMRLNWQNLQWFTSRVEAPHIPPPPPTTYI